MRIGLAVPQYGFSLPSGEIRATDAIAWAQRAEALGFDSVWLSDHFFYSFARYGAVDEPISALEPETTLAAIAATTTRVRLGILVECATFRHPALVAKAAATTDQLSGGRVDVGLGAGWLEQEFDAFGYRFGTVGERFDALEDALAITSGLFGGVDPLTHEGRVWSLHGGRLTPPPVQQPIPIWAGGKGGPRLLAAAVRWASGWNTVWRMAPEAYAAAVAAVRDACGQAGRDVATFGLSLGLYGTIGGTEAEAEAAFERARAAFPGDAMRDETWASWRADTLSGSLEQVRDRAGAFAELGVTDLIVSPWALPFAVAEPEQVDLFAEALAGDDSF
jgi:alkanesulfonate monooxygenase SsuD/methylene tetrahydromethanopterin reductase-like flavin-dependent oxidoreductase (luciferase family)